MKTQPMLPSSSGHLIITKGLIFIAIVLSEILVLLQMALWPLSAVGDFQLLVQIWPKPQRAL